MKALFISVQQDLDVLGLKSLHYTLRADGHQSVLLFLPLFDPASPADVEALRRFIREADPGFVGISLMSTEYFKACGVSAIVRTTTKAPVIWGGIHPTIAPETCLDHADAVCIGEGEQTIRDIAAALERGGDLRTVRNLCYRDGAELRRNELYPYLEDLDRLPVPDHVPVSSFVLSGARTVPLTAGNIGLYARYRGTSYSIMSSRGCPFSCTYCCNNFLAGLYHTKKVRRRSVAHVIAELETAVRDFPRISLVNFQDDSFLTTDVASLREFGRGYRRRVGRPFVIRCIPASVTREKLGVLLDAGLSWVSMGLQSGSDRVCEQIYKRRSNTATFHAAAAVVHELGIAAFYDVILDNPLEEERDLLATARALSATPRPFYLQLYSLTCYPGTEIHAMTTSLKPGDVADYRSKEYLSYDSSRVLNALIRVSAYLPPAWTLRLLRRYEKRPSGVIFLTAVRIANVLSIGLFEPVSYLRILLRSHRGSLWSLLKQAPNLLGGVLDRYRLQFARRR